MKENVECPTQADKFKEAARKHEVDDDEAAWEARLKKVVKPAKGKKQASG